MSATDAPIKVSDEFISDIQANNATASYSLMSDAAKNATSANDFETAVNQISPILTGKPSVTSREIAVGTDKLNTATIVYSIQGTDAKYDMTITLQENNGKWQVLNFESKVQQ